MKMKFIMLFVWGVMAAGGDGKGVSSVSSGSSNAGQSQEEIGKDAYEIFKTVRIDDEGRLIQDEIDEKLTPAAQDALRVFARNNPMTVGHDGNLRTYLGDQLSSQIIYEHMMQDEDASEFWKHRNDIYRLLGDHGMADIYTTHGWEKTERLELYCKFIVELNNIHDPQTTTANIDKYSALFTSIYDAAYDAGEKKK